MRRCAFREETEVFRRKLFWDEKLTIIELRKKRSGLTPGVIIAYGESTSFGRPCRGARYSMWSAPFSVEMQQEDVHGAPSPIRQCPSATRLGPTVVDLCLAMGARSSQARNIAAAKAAQGKEI